MKRLIALMICAVSLGAAAQIDWDFPYNPDGNNDGYIFSEDLLDLLTVYGQEFNSEELYLSQDSSSLIVYVGELIATECISTCLTLDGNWKVVGWKDLYAHYDDLVLDLGLINSSDNFTWVWVQNGFDLNDQPQSALSLRNRNLQFLENDGVLTNIGAFYSVHQPTNNFGEGYSYECWCATQQRPKVEYKVILFDGDDSNLEPLINEAAQEGWRLMPAVNGAGDKATMWRWAE